MQAAQKFFEEIGADIFAILRVGADVVDGLRFSEQSMAGDFDEAGVERLAE